MMRANPPTPMGGGFAEWAMVSLHCLRLHMEKSYRVTVDYLKEMPRITGGIGLEIPDVPELNSVHVNSFANEMNLGVDLYFAPIPRGEVGPIPDDVADAPEQIHELRETRGPTYLKELGGEYAEFSESLLTILSAYCDVPENERHRQFGGKKPGFLCKNFLGEECAVFGTYVVYPDYVGEIYSEGKEAAARRFGLPY